MWKVTIKGLLAHKLRLALTALAIVLGVTFISGTFVLTDTLHNTFTTLFGHIYQNVDFEVRGQAAFSSNNGGGGRGPQADPRSRSLTTVRQRPRRGLRRRGPSAATPSSSPPTARRSAPGAHRPSGLSFDPNPQLSSLHLSEGTAPTTPHDVVMDAGTAQKYHFTVGDHVRILLAGPTADLHHHRDRQIRHRQQSGRGHHRRLRPAHGPAAVRRGRATTTPSTS